MIFKPASKRMRLWIAAAALSLGAVTLSAPSHARGFGGGGGGFHGGGGGGFHGGMGGFHGGVSAFHGRMGMGGFHGGVMRGFGPLHRPIAFAHPGFVHPFVHRPFFFHRRFVDRRFFFGRHRFAVRHRFFRRGFAFVGSPYAYYDDASYDACYAREWTPWGWRWVSVCY